MLRLALPYWASRARELSGAQLRTRPAQLVDLLAHANITFRGGDGQNFNAIAGGLGLLSLCPGGPDRIEQWLAEMERL
jgi:hypothetical protein